MLHLLSAATMLTETWLSEKGCLILRTLESSKCNSHLPSLRNISRYSHALTFFISRFLSLRFLWSLVMSKIVSLFSWLPHVYHSVDAMRQKQFHKLPYRSILGQIQGLSIWSWRVSAQLTQHQLRVALLIWWKGLSLQFLTLHPYLFTSLWTLYIQTGALIANLYSNIFQNNISH